MATIPQGPETTLYAMDKVILKPIADLHTLMMCIDRGSSIYVDNHKVAAALIRKWELWAVIIGLQGKRFSWTPWFS